MYTVQIDIKSRNAQLIKRFSKKLRMRLSKDIVKRLDHLSEYGVMFQLVVVK